MGVLSLFGGRRSSQKLLQLKPAADQRREANSGKAEITVFGKILVLETFLPLRARNNSQRAFGPLKLTQTIQHLDVFQLQHLASGNSYVVKKDLKVV